MKKTSTIFLAILCFFAFNLTSKAQISGSVYRDYNGNGDRGVAAPNNEPAVSGVVVNAYNDAAVLIASYTTSNLGVYTIPTSGTYNGIVGSNTGSVSSGTKVRLEFIIIATGCDLSPTLDYSSTKGPGNATSVQFVTGGAATTNINFAINGSGDYTTNTNPNMVMPASVNGNPLAASGTATTDDAFVGFPYNSSGTTAPTRTMAGVKIGSCWGVAYSRQAGKIFTAAFVKRHAGLGTLGSGGIYILTPGTTSFTAADFYDMDANGNRTRAGVGAPAYGLGTSYNLTGDENITFLGATDVASGLPIGYGVIGTNVERGLPDNNTSTSYDAAAFEQTGKAGLADIEISDDGKYLFVTNLYDKKIYRLELNSATNPTSVIAVTSYVLPVVTATNGVLRPFGIEFKRGKLYVGAVTTGENGGTAANLSAYVFTLNNATSSASFATTPALNFPLNYAKGPSMTWTTPDYGANWRPWSKVTSDPEGETVNRTYPTPILSDIEFDERGTMIAAFMDRSGNQYSEDNLRHLRNVTTLIRYAVGGDVIAANSNCNGTYTTENNGSYTASNGTTYTSGAANNQGIGNSEFFKGDLLVTFHEETTTGALAYLLGSDEVYASLMDPTTTTNVGGVARLSMINGGKTTGYVLTGSGAAGWGKANSLGDLEIIGELSPIEIGNRIWNDANGNGIQDPSELPIANVTLEIFVDNNNDGVPDGAAIGTTTTSATGEWYFNNANITGDADPNTTGIQATLTSGVRYIVRPSAADWTGGVGVGDLAGLQLTKKGAVGSGALDYSDNDASLVGTIPIPQISVLAGAAGENNHNLDFGFKQLASLGNKVWLDEGAGGGTAQNGIQDGTEPGVANVAVNLYQNGADGLPGTADDVLVGSTITDAFGNYLFENLAPSTGATTQYNIRVTPPSNYSFTVNTNTTDDNNTSGASTTGNDVNALGVSYSIDLSAGENNPNIDAGLIFRPQPVLNSIGDRVWLDNGAGANAGNGNQDAGEPGVAGVTVTLYDDATGNVVAVTTTDANGNYIFNNLPANTNYKVGFSAPAGTVLSPNVGGTTIGNGTTNSDANPATGLTTTINSGVAGTQITGVDAGLTSTHTKGALGDFVFNDLNRNGIQDAGEPGVPGVTMRLYGAGPNGVIGGGDDVLIGTTTTDANGYYVFPNLDPAKYFVTATPVTGYTNTTANQGSNDTKDSDFITGTGTYTGSYVSNLYNLLPVAGGVTRDMTVDLGIFSNTAVNTLNTLGDRVWNDVNKNGIQDAGEPSVPNVTVRLLNASGVAVNNPATGKPYVTTTDANGNYKFVDLPDGNYIVEFANLPTGFVFTSQDASGTGAPGSVTDGTTDSDVKTTTGRTAIISVDGASASATSVNIINVDAGITQGTPAGTASLGNRVWYDNNNNGLQDAGELGVNNVRVELLDAAGASIDGDPSTAGVQPYVVYTNALGEYQFTGLPAGDYTVRFGNFPIGFTSSTANVGANDAIDADANFGGASIATTTATTAVYTLQTGEDNNTVDMGIVPPTAANSANNSLGNFVWNDTNANGIQDAGEVGVPGVMVTLYRNGADGLPGTADDVVAGITTTDANGAYSFVGLADGNYNVGFSNLPAGFKFSEKDAAGSTAANGSDANTASGRTGTVALDPTSASATGIVNNDVDAGINTTRASLGNFVWNDTNGDGIQDPTESGISGVTVTLYAADGTTVLGSTITGANGQYNFSNLNPGTYVVGFSNLPNGVSFTQQNGAGDNGDNSNSDANPLTGLTSVITLSAGENETTIDAGVRPNIPASVGDFVWNDLNNNGIQDPNEPGVPGVLVTLYDANTNAVIGTAITDGNGGYLISKINAATAGTSYYIIFSNLPNTAVFTGQNVGGSTAANGSDANVSTGRTANFTLIPGQYLPSIDAGIQNVQLLPIKIQSFTAAPQGSKVNLQWIVSEQQDAANYDVETSTDGRTFVKIAIVGNNGSADATYNEVHTTPAAGINYYRIKTISKNGTIFYSVIRTVNFGKAGAVIIYPNPVATGTVNITLTGSMINTVATVSIISLEGKLVSQQIIAKTSQTENIDISNLANGTYILKVMTATEVVTTKLVVSK